MILLEILEERKEARAEQKERQTDKRIRDASADIMSSVYDQLKS